MLDYVQIDDESRSYVNFNKPSLAIFVVWWLTLATFDI